VAGGRDICEGQGVKGLWTYLYRAVDSRGQTIDFLLSAKQDAAAAKRFFRKALAQLHAANPRTITVDKNPAYPKAIAEMKRDVDGGFPGCALTHPLISPEQELRRMRLRLTQLR
jgi:transposase-like protein